MKKRTGNRGFTLVELMIAIAILALVLTPLVANFIQSSKINLKGRKSLNAMNLAQDIMEGMSGYTADEVIKLVDAVENDATGSKTLVGSLLPNSATYGSISTVSAPGDAVIKYQLDDVVTVAGARNEYDVKVTLNPTGDEHKEFNQKEYAAIAEVNQYYDAVYTHDSTETEAMINKFYQESNHTKQADAFRGKLKRTFTVVIDNEGTESSPKYRISVAREYALVDTALAGTTDLTGVVLSPPTTANISRMDESQLPRSIYFYYEGIQNASYNDSPRRDNIKVHNKTGKPITVYLMRVQEADAASNAAYAATYGCEVDIISENMSGVRDHNVHVVSNLRCDLNAASMEHNYRTHDEDGTALDSNTFPKDEAGNTIATSYKKERAIYRYNDAVLTEAIYQTNFSNGYASKKKNALYKVEIEIYVKGTSEKVATYSGGLSN